MRVAALARLYPDASCALVHRNPYELIVATILSAQCTDARVNLVTPPLFARYPDANALSQADPDELEGLIRSTGFFRSKAKNLQGMALRVVERHGGVACARDNDGRGGTTVTVSFPAARVGDGLPDVPQEQ